MAEPSATARDQKPVDDLHPNGVMRQVASGKRGKFLSELGQDLKLPFDVANWDFQLLWQVGALSATPAAILPVADTLVPRLPD